MYEATAPQSIGGVLDSGFRLFRSAFKSTFVLAFVIAFLAAPAGRFSQSFAVTTPSGGLLLAFIVGLFAYIVISLVLYGALIEVIDRVARGEPAAVGSALGVGLRRGPALFVVGFCYSFAVLVGMILLLVPGLWLMVALLFGFFAAVIDGKGPIDSLGYSMRLVRGHWWRTTGVLTVIFFIAMVIYFIIGMIGGAAAVFQTDALIETGNLPWYIDFIIVPVLSAIVVPLMYTMTYAVYRDLKLRLEGADLADRIAAAAQ